MFANYTGQHNTIAVVLEFNPPSLRIEFRARLDAPTDRVPFGSNKTAGKHGFSKKILISSVYAQHVACVHTYVYEDGTGTT